MIYEVIFAPLAREMLGEIQDRRVAAKILETADRLQRDPEKQGKPLAGELRGYRSLRAAGQRYCIIYKVAAQRVTVHVVALGLRKEGDKHDIYRRIQKLAHLKLL